MKENFNKNSYEIGYDISMESDRVALTILENRLNHVKPKTIYVTSNPCYARSHFIKDLFFARRQLS